MTTYNQSLDKTPVIEKKKEVRFKEEEPEGEKKVVFDQVIERAGPRGGDVETVSHPKMIMEADGDDREEKSRRCHGSRP